MQALDTQILTLTSACDSSCISVANEGCMARALSPPKHTPAKQLSLDEMQAGINRLTQRLKDINAFDVNAMTQGYPPELTALSASIERALSKTFGKGTEDYNRFLPATKLAWTPIAVSADRPTPLYQYQNGVKNNIARSNALLNEAIRSLTEDIGDSEARMLIVSPSSTDKKEPSRRVFIVHGHDEGARESVARFIEQIGMEAVILHERPNKGRTIITKFRDETKDVGFAIVLMTPDDHGGKIGLSAQPRARQNVVFELGFFIGALGPEKVAALVKGDVERPSDYDGVVYISLDDGSWKANLAKELEAAGIDVDWNKVMRT
jgi:predicted nucleotide-binding protein